MNNKFIKRVAAVVLGVAVLSTCAFAAPTTISDTDYASENLYFTLSAAGADKVSYIAYASDAQKTQGTIVAIGQYDGSTGGTETLPISADLLGDATHILLKSGNSTGAAASEVLIPTSAFIAAVTGGEAAEVTAVDGTPIEGAYEFKITVDFNKAGKVQLSALTAKIEGETDRTLSKIADLNTKLNTNYDANAKVEVNFYLAGAPAGKTITLVPTCDFTPAN